MKKAALSFTARQELIQGDFEVQHKKDRHLQKVELHHHDFYELVFLVSGDVTYQIEGRLYPMNPGDLLLVSPRELHQVSIAPETAPYDRYVLWMKPSELRRLSTRECNLEQALGNGSVPCNNLMHPEEELKRMIQWNLETLYQEAESDSFGAALLPDICLKQLLILIGRLKMREPEALPEVPDELTEKVLSYLSTHYHEKISLEQLSSEFYISKYHLCHEFQKHMGISIYQYLQKKRLQIAREMLQEGISPALAGQKAGFSDYAGFFRAFRKEYGQSPKNMLKSLI